MASPETRRRLIVNADDFGRSHSINEAVICAHREGILTSASLMVNEEASEEAVALARANPTLGVGLHLTLLRGYATLPPEQTPGLANAHGEFSNNPVGASIRYFIGQGLREQLRAEIHAQFQRFNATGLLLDHVNGHLHLHLHPTVFQLLIQDADKLGIRHMRLTREPFWMDAFLTRGRRLYRSAHAVIFFALGRFAEAGFRRKNIRHTQRVFGLLEDSRVDEAYVLKLLGVLPAGDSELYSHPSLEKFRHELDALISPQVNGLVRQLGVELIRYQDL